MLELELLSGLTSVRCYIALICVLKGLWVRSTDEKTMVKECVSDGGII
jgi:hypothetical protein